MIIGKESNSNLINELDFNKGNGLIPTILKDKNGKVLTLVYSNKESLIKTLKEKKPYFFSRARNRVCLKGETSGNTQELIEIKKDCDNDALLFIIKQKGNACCKNTYSCFGEEYEFTLEEQYSRLIERINSGDDNSYTKKLVNDPELLKRKLIEEAAEVITSKNREELIWEAADLLYFLLVILAKNKVTLSEINKENARRDKEKVNKSNNLNKIGKETK